MGGILGLKKIFSSRKSDRWAIALDIGTEFVKTVVFEVVNEKAHIRGVGRQRQKLSDMQGGAVTDIHGVIKNCEKALEQAASACKVMPYQVVIGIAGELVKGTTTNIKYKRESAKNQITLPELNQIISKVQKKAFEQARQMLAFETGHQEIDVRLVNAAIVDVKIDGYKVTNPLGFQGKDIEVGVFNAFAPIVHLGALQTIAQELELDLLSIAAEPYAVAQAVTQEESTDFSAIFIDVGGGTTDVAIVSSGGVAGTKMFALGGRAFTKKIAFSQSLSFEKSEALKLDYSQGKLSPARQEKIRKMIQTDAQIWGDGIELTLSEFTNLELLPGRILLCGGGSALPEIIQILRDSKWRKQLPFPRPPKISFLKPASVARIIDETGELKQPADVTPLALASIAVELVGRGSVVDSVITKLVSSLSK